jgi:hypothetical protein
MISSYRGSKAITDRAPIIPGLELQVVSATRDENKLSKRNIGRPTTLIAMPVQLMIFARTSKVALTRFAKIISLFWAEVWFVNLLNPSNPFIKRTK